MNYTIKNKDELEKLIQFYEDNKVYDAQITVPGDSPREVLTNLYNFSEIGKLVITDTESLLGNGFSWKVEVQNIDDDCSFDELLTAIKESWE